MLKSIGNSNLPIFNFFNQPSIEVRFDPNMKMFVINVETQKHGTENKSNGVIKDEASMESEEED